jgi:3-oxoacyl-[acyl-carrier-protein] synthase-1
MPRRKILITGTGAVCASGMDPGAILAAARDGHSAIGPIAQWDTTGWPVRVAAEMPDFNPRALVEDRKLHKLIRRSDMFGLYAGSQAIDAAGFMSARDGADAAAAAAFNDRSGLYVGSGGGAYMSQYEYFPLMSETDGALPAFGRDLGNEVNPMWLLRTLPNNVLCHVGIKYGLKGSNACITNHSAGGTLAVIEAAKRCAREIDRAIAIGHDAPIEPQMVLYYHQCGLLASDTIRPFDQRRSGSVFGEGAGALALETEDAAESATPSRWAKCSAAAMRPKARTARDSRGRRWSLPRDHAGAGRSRARAGGYRDDRRPRQRHAAVGLIGSGGVAWRVRHRKRGATGHRVQVGDRTSDRRGRHHGDGDRAGRTARAHRPGHRHADLARS